MNRDRGRETGIGAYRRPSTMHHPQPSLSAEELLSLEKPVGCGDPPSLTQAYAIGSAASSATTVVELHVAEVHHA